MAITLMRAGGNEMPCTAAAMIKRRCHNVMLGVFVQILSAMCHTIMNLRRATVEEKMRLSCS